VSGFCPLAGKFLSIARRIIVLFKNW